MFFAFVLFILVCWAGFKISTFAVQISNKCKLYQRDFDLCVDELKIAKSKYNQTFKNMYLILSGYANQEIRLNALVANKRDYSSVLFILERFPELKSDKAFMQTLDQVPGFEAELVEAKKKVSRTYREYQYYRSVLPQSLITRFLPDGSTEDSQLMHQESKDKDDEPEQNSIECENTNRNTRLMAEFSEHDQNYQDAQARKRYERHRAEWLGEEVVDEELKEENTQLQNRADNTAIEIMLPQTFSVPRNKFRHKIDLSNHRIPQEAIDLGWTLHKHIGKGVLDLDPSKLELFYAPRGNFYELVWLPFFLHKLKKGKIPILNDSVLDYLLDHPEIIPESWKTGRDDKLVTRIDFLGTEYRSPSGEIHVRGIMWNALTRKWESYGGKSISIQFPLAIYGKVGSLI
ncbi:MAG: hypothetical protein ACD_48C00174G0003 [uncultured bacterium]|nr:MAG: hypothetical protein ACD_48C00174G0003 [uncultured bacterium]